jgi:hypothetical protein
MRPGDEPDEPDQIWKPAIWSQFGAAIETLDQLRGYLAHGREECRATVSALTGEKARQRCSFAWGEVTFLELLLYTMRHVREHAAQLSLFLGQKGLSIPDYVTRAASPIGDG